MSHSLRTLLITLVIGIVSGLVFGLLSYSRGGFLEHFEKGTFDLKMSAARKLSPDNLPYSGEIPVVYFDIDDGSLLNKEFPLPRDEYIKAVKVLKDAGAKAIAFDLIFPESAHRRVTYERLDNLHEKIDEILTDGEKAQEDKEYEIHDGVESALNWDVDIALAKAAKDHGSVYFPIEFSNTAFLENRIQFEKQTALAENEAEKFINYLVSSNELLTQWFDYSTDTDRLELLSRLMAQHKELKDGCLSSLLISQINKNLMNNVTNILTKVSGVSLSTIEEIAAHLDSPERGIFDQKFTADYNIKQVVLEEGYRKILNDRVFADIVANYEDTELVKELSKELGSDPGISDIAKLYYETILLELLSGMWVTAISFSNDFPEVDKELRKYLIVQRTSSKCPGKDSFPFSYDCNAPILPLLQESPSPSYIQITADSDGVIRHWPLLRIFEGQEEWAKGKPRLFSVMSLQALLGYLGVPLSEVDVVPGKWLRIPRKNGEVIEVPIDKQGRMTLNWGSADFKGVLPHYPFWMLGNVRDVYLKRADLTDEEKQVEYEQQLERLISPKVKDKIVLIGLTATGSHDMNPTPLSPRFPMVGAHGACIGNILNGTAIRRVSPLVDFLLTFGVIVLFCALLAYLPVLYSSILTVLVLTGYTYLSYRFQLNCFWVNTIYVVSGTLLASVLVFAAKYAIEGRSRAVLKRIFSTYLSPKLVEQMADHLPTLKLGGESVEATVYFSDIAGFTSMSEKLSPEELVELLNRYLTLMTDNILENDGLLDKYIGDAIVAAFGVPFSDEDHAKHACRSALRNNIALAELNRQLEGEGKPLIGQRIGISTGPLVAGNMGSERRLAYTVMGDTVNLGSRMENANKYYGSRIMISESTFSKLDDEFFCRKLDKLRVVGKRKPVEVFELVGFSNNLSASQREGYSLFEKAISLYFERKWTEARGIFEEAQKLLQEDRPCDTFINRCNELINEPLPEDWDGVWELRTK